MYFDFAVTIPLEKGKIITKKKGNAVYVLYQHGQVYKPDKKYAIPQRTIIGKINPDDPDTMYPNERFQEFFPTVILPEELPEAYRSCALRIGSYAVIKKVLDDYEIPRMLMNYFYKESGLILDLVAYMIVDEENAGQYYPDFAFNHPLFSKNMRIYSDSKVCRLLKSISKEQINAFLNEWNDNRDHKQRIYVSYDSTNKNCNAGDIDLIEYGKPKNDQGLPIFNLAIAYDKNNRVPLFYEEYPGSITDVSQFRYMVDKVEQYNYKNVGFILDRGYFSKENIQYMDDNKHPFVIMLRGRRNWSLPLYTNTVTPLRRIEAVPFDPIEYMANPYSQSSMKMIPAKGSFIYTTIHQSWLLNANSLSSSLTKSRCTLTNT